MLTSGRRALAVSSRGRGTILASLARGPCRCPPPRSAGRRVSSAEAARLRPCPLASLRGRGRPLQQRSTRPGGGGLLAALARRRAWRAAPLPLPRRVPAFASAAGTAPGGAAWTSSLGLVGWLIDLLRRGRKRAVTVVRGVASGCRLRSLLIEPTRCAERAYLRCLYHPCLPAAPLSPQGGAPLCHLLFPFHPRVGGHCRAQRQGGRPIHRPCPPAVLLDGRTPLPAGPPPFLEGPPMLHQRGCCC